MFLVIEQIYKDEKIVGEKRVSPNYKTSRGAKLAKARRYAFSGKLQIATTDMGW